MGIDMVVIVAIIVALGEVVKRTGIMPVKYLPIANVILGVIAGVVYLDGSVQDSVLLGIAIGLSASGVFDLTKFKK